MEIIELLEIINRGEDSKHQFKETIKHSSQLAAELAAFSNSEGGILLLGITDDGIIKGLSFEEVNKLNQLISNTASQAIRPPINPRTENLKLPQGLIIIVYIERGLNKPYITDDGIIWVKNGADKRKITAREELQRMFQSTALIHADEIPVTNTSLNDLDRNYFEAFFERNYGESLESQEISLIQLLENMNLMKMGQLNLTAVLLFARYPHFRLPTCIVKAVAFSSDNIEDVRYSDSQDMEGKLADVFQKSLSFIIRNLRQVQKEQGVNSLGKLEIPQIVFEELLVNALIHRDYFISATIKVFIFNNRIEIISPGHLPNNLTIENIKRGNSNIRNPVLTSFATKILPYRGLGSGILRALKTWAAIDFKDDREANLFKVIIWRENYP